jgi:hypothetical protein
MSPDDKAEKESRRIIDRVGMESEPSMLGRARDHVRGKDADEKDWVELWGTRIGRWVGVVFLLYLIWWLFDFAMTSG